MNSNPTVSVRSLLAALIILIALTMAYAVGVRSDGGESAAASTRPVAAEAEGTAPEPSIVMTGKGEVTAVPDRTRLRRGRDSRPGPTSLAPSSVPTP